MKDGHNGRFNHYLFDMNRDWLPVQLPSQARIKTFRNGCQMYCVISMKWEPIPPTFQPGEPRTNLATPDLNQN
jgi:hypothetical protein